jgi:hypothetical protein
VARKISLIVTISMGLMGSGCAEEGKTKTMDSAMAYELVSAWARAEKEDTSSIEREANGDFRGDAASLAFQFEGVTQTLIVRGRILSGLAEVRKYPDVMQELQRIAREEPARVVHAQFDLARMPWDPDEEPALYLRRDYKATESEAKLFGEWRKLREMAYLWHRIYFRQAIDPIVQRRLKQQ